LRKTIFNVFYCRFEHSERLYAISRVSLSTTAGDIGGYLGLLIGGSVLTVIEVVDLVCYNVILRCFGRR